MKIIPAAHEHLSEIIELNKIVDYENPDSFMKESVDLWRVLVAIKDNSVVWFLLYQELWGNTIFLALIKVHSDFYGQGIGSQLLQDFEILLQNKWIKSYISSTMPENEWAQRFHLQKEFKHIWDLQMYHGSEIFYRKEL